MERKELLKYAKTLYEYHSTSDSLKHELENEFPELKESEDERIRGAILIYLDWLDGRKDCQPKGDYTIRDMIAYLEKQKEQKPIEKQNYSGLNDLERAIHRGFLSAGVENVPVTIIKETAKECLAQMKPAEWKPEPESLEALMYAIEGKWEMIKPTSYLSRRLEDLYEGLVNTFNVNEVYLEELPKVASTGDIEELKALKHKIYALMDEKSAGGSSEKPNSQWSEEDETRLDSIIANYRELLQDYKACHDVDYIPYTSDTFIRNVVDDVDFLKSLRPQPHWKPSKEQMESLYNAVVRCRACSNTVHLPELYEDLKTL